MRAGCGHTGPCTAVPFTTHKDINRDVSRSQDHDRLHWATQIWPLKVTARHTDTHTWGKKLGQRSWQGRGNMDVGDREWWTGVLTKKGRSRPSEKGRGFGLNS